MATTAAVVLSQGGPASIPVPPAVRWGSALLARVLAEGRVVGEWEFRLAENGAPLRAVLSLPNLDQRSVTVEHPGSPPIAVRFRRGEMPVPGERLRLELGTWSGSWITYPLVWSSPEVERTTFEAWSRGWLPEAEWFYVELTSACNLSCPFCPSKDMRRPRTHMTLEVAHGVFSEIGAYMARRDRSLGYVRAQRMVFLHVMGEPLLHPRFDQVIRAALDAGLAPALFTNATLLEGGRAARLLDSGIRHVTLSINTPTAAAYGSLGARDTLGDQERRVVGFLRQRAERGAFGLHVDIQFMTSPGPDGIEGLLSSRQQFWDLYRRWLLLVRHLPHPSEALQGTQPVSAEAVLDPLTPGSDPSKRFPLAHGVDLVVKTGCWFANAVIPPGKRVAPSERGRCPFDCPSHQLVVFADGSVSFCSLDHENSVNLGSLVDQSIDEIWASPRLRTIRAAMSQGYLSEPLCQRCQGRLESVAGAGAPARARSGGEVQ